MFECAPTAVAAAPLYCRSVLFSCRRQAVQCGAELVDRMPPRPLAPRFITFKPRSNKERYFFLRRQHGRSAVVWAEPRPHRDSAHFCAGAHAGRAARVPHDREPRHQLCAQARACQDWRPEHSSPLPLLAHGHSCPRRPGACIRLAFRLGDKPVAKEPSWQMGGGVLLSQGLHPRLHVPGSEVKSTL